MNLIGVQSDNSLPILVLFNIQGVQEGQNRYNGQGQQKNNNIIYMADDISRAIRDYAVFDPPSHKSWNSQTEVQVDHFKLKSIMF